MPKAVHKGAKGILFSKQPGVFCGVVDISSHVYRFIREYSEVDCVHTALCYGKTMSQKGLK